MKRKTKYLIRFFAFLVLILSLVMSSSYMLAPKDNTKQSGIINPNANGFYSEPKNSIEVAVIGNSDAYSGFSPMELWNNYGYTSYVSGEGRQTVAQAYEMLTNLLKNQKPQVIILETDEFFTKSNFFDSAYSFFNATFGAPFSVFKYHNRWKTVKLNELLKKPQYTAHCVSKGQFLSNDVKPYRGKEYMIKTDKKAVITMSTKKYIETFVKTCRDNNVDVLFLELPSQSSWNYEKHNAVNELAGKLGVSFIDMNIELNKIGFNWETDSRDGGDHLNNRGARKCTVFMGEYLKRNYKLEDRRGQVKYKQWDEDYKSYLKIVKIR